VHQGSGAQLRTPAHLLSAAEVVRGLNVDPDNGLSEEEARARVQIAGPNELAGGGGVSPLRILAGQIFNAMVLVSGRFRVQSRVSRVSVCVLTGGFAVRS